MTIPVLLSFGILPGLNLVRNEINKLFSLSLHASASSFLKGGRGGTSSNCKCRGCEDCSNIQDIQKWQPSEGDCLPKS